MSKNIVVYSDGTGQDGGIRPEQRVSNIYKMYRGSRVSFENAIDPAAQVTMYDPGLGTDIGATALTAPRRFLQKLISSIDGRGITTNIIDCYTFILNHYHPGDRIFLFGFSRGAYTVRSVADLLRLCGVPTKTPDGDVPRFRSKTRSIAEEATLTVLEHGAGHPRDEFEEERDELARRFREKYGSNHPSGEVQRSNVAPYFVGVFDTVAALGARGLRRFAIQAFLFALVAALGLVPSLLVAIVGRTGFGLPFWASLLWTEMAVTVAGIAWFLHKQRLEFKKTIHDYPRPGESRSHKAQWEGRYFNRLLSRFVTYARSANAIDETRADFDRVPWGPTITGPQETSGILTFKQYFFAGNHSDIGGSYAEAESRLSDIALDWMLHEAVNIPDGLRIGPVHVNGIKMSGTGELGTALYLYPADDGVQHSEVAATRDWIQNLRPRLLAWLLRNRNYTETIRSLPDDAVVHPSAVRRFNLSGVQQPEGFGPYRPEILRSVAAFADYYGGDRLN
jgi:uncharacterized protein (DUF2235 family)